MNVKKALFVKSSTTVKDCPAPNQPEYAFCGRSNVGKSSLINRLVNQNQLAKTSQQPGKTQLINHYLVNDQWYLVDLPGYGYAKISQEQRKKWQAMIQDYLRNRNNLVCVFLLIDVRLEPQKNDLEFISWMGAEQIPFALIFTKADKQSAAKSAASVAHFQSALAEEWETLPPCFVTSSLDGRGMDEILDYIAKINASI